MKYFLYEDYVALNLYSTSEEELERLENEWSVSVQMYRDEFKTLADRLPKEVFNRFVGWGFHDYELVKMEIQHTTLLHTNINLTLVGTDKWILSFENISFFQFRHINYHNEKPVFSREVDNWLFEEFLSVDDSLLSFEVTFSSGGSILAHFPDQSVSIRKVK